MQVGLFALTDPQKEKIALRNPCSAANAALNPNYTIVYQYVQGLLKVRWRHSKVPNRDVRRRSRIENGSQAHHIYVYGVLEKNAVLEGSAAASKLKRLLAYFGNPLH